MPKCVQPNSAFASDMKGLNAQVEKPNHCRECVRWTFLSLSQPALNLR